MPTLTPTDLRIPASQLGESWMTKKEFIRKLGRVSYVVWTAFCKYRDMNGLSYLSRRGCAQYTKISPREVARATLRLCKLGLLVNKNRKRIQVSILGEPVWVFPREVYGSMAYIPGKNLEFAMIPRASWWAIKNLKGRGGARKGAGRPPKIKVGPYQVEDSQVFLNSNLKSNLEVNLEAKLEEKPKEKLIKIGSRIYIYNTIHNKNHTYFVSKGFCSRKNRGSIQNLEKKPVEGTQKMLAPAKDLGSFLGGNIITTPVKIPIPGRDGIPPFPDLRVMPLAVIPHPPLLDTDLDDASLAAYLVTVYRGAIMSRFKKDTWVLAKRSQLLKSRYYSSLVRCARMLMDEEIPPAAWATFSIDFWNDSRPKGQPKPKLPPISWIFNPARVESQCEWFRDVAPDYLGGRVISNDAAKELSKRYFQMQRSLMHAQVIEHETVQEIVNRYFPNGLYDKLLGAAKERAQDDQLRMNKMLERGEWLWG